MIAREKLLQYGRLSMTDEELITCIISDKETAKRLMKSVDHYLPALTKLSVEELMQIEGMTSNRAAALYAAMELWRRRQTSEMRIKTQVRGSSDIYRYVRAKFDDLSHEEFWVIMLNRANHIIKMEQVSSGGTAGTVVDSRILFKMLLLNKASSFVCVHNHPSGQVRPSQSDIDLTKKLKNGGALIDIIMLDHIIVGCDNGYYSFADEGML